MDKLMAEQLTKIKSQIMKTSDIIIGFLGEQHSINKKEGHTDVEKDNTK